jgi:Cu/Ag efflux pump CusA
MGGLATSTILTLYVIPAVYTILDDLKDRFYHPGPKETASID